MKLFKIVFLLLFSSGVALMAFAYFMGYFDNTQSKICRELKPSVTEADLVRALGPPESQKENIDYRKIYFRADILAPGPIEAKVDKKTNKVIQLRCSHDGPATWGARQ